MLKIYTTEYCEQGIVVSQKVIKLFGLPIYSRTMETSNYNYVGQFDANNFQSTSEDNPPKIYTETNIGFQKDEEETK